ncbi:hypothetical protein ET475_05905 [Microbacterium protaetiae]|uniref:DUF5615 domain-containing protein n=1 Tax=Microbacterium protaetiae TaxID=2509458 RepID=A0A4P6EBL4_9MICO|nr:DUF5615 family PIN-like protein [Microbacterium protaetiae]QAY59565.1 hypothetical protein ET475_05905 [Microbacterium protaetiae]
MTSRLLLDEHCGESIAAALRERGHDVVAVVADPELRGAPDADVFRAAAESGRRIVTENIKDFRPLLMEAAATGTPLAALLLAPPRRFPRGRGDRVAAIVAALNEWLAADDVTDRPVEDWLV